MTPGVSRRRFVEVGALTVVGLAVRVRLRPRTIEVRMRSDATGAKVGFSPRGLAIAPGDVVRWVMDGPNVHTTTAYHPSNGNAPLRMPPTARPWDSGFMMKPGDRFEVTFTVPGVYDYFCQPHEAVGMVGRIVVGEPGPAPYFSAPDPAWRAIPQAALAAFPPVDAIVRQGRIE